MKGFSMDPQPYTRLDLLQWSPNDERQTHAWDRLRRVCIELGVEIPTMLDIRHSHQGFDKLYPSFRQRYFPDTDVAEEYASFVICRLKDGEIGAAGEEDRTTAYVNFNVGYRLD
jgi:hypothetical protein